MFFVFGRVSKERLNVSHGIFTWVTVLGNFEISLIQDSNKISENKIILNFGIN